MDKVWLYVGRIIAGTSVPTQPPNNRSDSLVFSPSAVQHNTLFTCPTRRRPFRTQPNVR